LFGGLGFVEEISVEHSVMRVYCTCRKKARDARVCGIMYKEGCLESGRMCGT